MYLVLDFFSPAFYLPPAVVAIFDLSFSFLPVKEKNNQSVHRPSQNAATFFAVSDDLKQRVSKVQGTFTIVYKVYIKIYNPNPSS